MDSIVFTVFEWFKRGMIFATCHGEFLCVLRIWSSLQTRDENYFYAKWYKCYNFVIDEDDKML